MTDTTRKTLAREAHNALRGFQATKVWGLYVKALDRCREIGLNVDGFYKSTDPELAAANLAEHLVLWNYL